MFLIVNRVQELPELIFQNYDVIDIELDENVVTMFTFCRQIHFYCTQL